MSRYLSLPEACEIANVSRNTMKKYIVEGYVAAERLPCPNGQGRWRVSEESLLTLLQGAMRQQALDFLKGMRV
jgi:predicted site-specific integrase-resolvase